MTSYLYIRLHRTHSIAQPDHHPKASQTAALAQLRELDYLDLGCFRADGEPDSGLGKRLFETPVHLAQWVAILGVDEPRGRDLRGHLPARLAIYIVLPTEPVSRVILAATSSTLSGFSGQSFGGT